MPAKYLINASFKTSVADYQKDIKPALPEIAFAGRSNVGKSSLLNYITNRKNLAKISSTPGKTRLINFFTIDNQYYLVDLPGYGYAKVSKPEQLRWQKMLESYLLQSELLRMICLLVDIRHGLMASDRQMADWLNINKLPYMIILTKADKLKKSSKINAVRELQQEFPDHHVMPFSIKSEKYRLALVDVFHKLLL